ncbi:MAG: PD40 domain-containing protein, partial [Nannocystaceae bacterium]|nr:PD40 domain-containing protein [Nannocystaceae bacterium]
DAPPVDAELAEASPEAVFNKREGLPTVVLLDTNRFTATIVTGQGNPRSLSVSPDGKRVAFRVAGDGTDATEPGDDELAVASLVAGDGGGLKVLTLNALRDHSPRFTADGTHLAFRTRFEVPRTEWVLVAGRIVELTR